MSVRGGGGGGVPLVGGVWGVGAERGQRRDCAGAQRRLGPSRERAGEARTVLDGVGRLGRVANERLGAAAAALVVVDQLLVAHRGLGEPVLRADAGGRRG